MVETDVETQRARAVLRYYRMSPTKAREVLDLIRGKSAIEAVQVLSLVNREASEVVGKLLASAVANATVRFGLGANEVYVARAFADEGPTLKRFRPRARGRATRIRKRSCHITIEVEEMSLEMRRQQAMRASSRQTARRAQRVASSRRSDSRSEELEAATGARDDAATIEEPAALEAGVSEVTETEEMPAAVETTEVLEADVVDETTETPEDSPGEAEDERGDS